MSSHVPDQRLLGGEGQDPSRPAPTAGSMVQIQNLPKDELNALAEEFGLEPSRYRTPQHLVAAIHERRQLIATLDRAAMLDVVKWGRRPVPLNASKEQLAQEIIKVRSMRFGGLSQGGLLVLARLRGAEVRDADDIPTLVRQLKKQEGLFAKLNRKRRSWIGSMVSGLMGEDDFSQDYQFLPPQQGTGDAVGTGGATAAPPPPPPRSATLREDIEESGLFGGIAGRIKKSADTYVNQKLDEIEARIDRKLDEIDRRLAEWRDKEIANRIRILKITLWATIIVAAISLLYSYISQYLVPMMMGR